LVQTDNLFGTLADQKRPSLRMTNICEGAHQQRKQGENGQMDV